MNVCCRLGWDSGTQDSFLAAMKVGTVKNPRAIDIVIFSIASTHQRPETILLFFKIKLSQLTIIVDWPGRVGPNDFYK